MKERSSFTSRIGFVLAAAGSAVGLGNMWRFPYLAAKYGGGAFLITYVLLAVTFGFTLMITEVAMGRRTRMSCIEAFGSLNRRFAPLGWLAALIPVIIAPYYCVIGGWVVKYFVEFVRGNRAAWRHFVRKPVEIHVDIPQEYRYNTVRIRELRFAADFPLPGGKIVIFLRLPADASKQWKGFLQ